MNKKAKRVLQVGLLGFVVVSLAYALARESTKTPVATPNGVATTCLAGTNCNPQAKSLPHQVVAYYFHGNARCQSCLKIESYSADTIQSKFADQLKDGTLEWRVLNVEEPANTHFVQDYKLYTKSLVLVDLADGKQVKWKNLEKVWDYLGDPRQFSAYVESELKGYLSAHPGT